jgi:uncharacterized damage-inducible protein DinB
MSDTAQRSASVIEPDQLREHWQGHRRVTRRVIDAFPEQELFTFTVGGMRPFSELALEFLRMSVPIVRGVATGRWQNASAVKATTKSELLRLWDADTAEIDRLWPTIPPHRFQEQDVAFGQWPGPGWGTILYAIDNEIHHRGQGYVYLRALGIAPPPFFDRR